MYTCNITKLQTWRSCQSGTHTVHHYFVPWFFLMLCCTDITKAEDSRGKRTLLMESVQQAKARRQATAVIPDRARDYLPIDRLPPVYLSSFVYSI